METLNISLEQIVPSKTNPRKTFDEAQMKELTASVKEKGILQPILVRPVGKNGEQIFEIVAGERRFRAAKTLALTEIPVIQRELSDSEAMEIQVIENLQRADLHPLEEADSYNALMEKNGYSADDVAAKVGKSKAYIYLRLKLLSLCATARTHFSKNKLSLSVALLLARIPEAKMQEQALKELLREADHGEISYGAACEHIQRNYMTLLEKAPFDTQDANLLPEAGACATCPKRTGNQKELFPDIKRGDVCTDVACFQKKKASAWVRQAEEARKNGWTVLEASEADKICRYGWIDESSGYVDLNAVCQSDAKRRTWKRMLKKYVPPVTLIRNSREEVYELVRVAELKDALEKMGYKFKKEEKTYERQTTAVDRKMIRVKREACLLATNALVTKLETYSYGDLINLAVPLVIRTRGFNALWEVVKRRGLVESRKDDYQAALKKEVSRLGEGGLKGLLVELLVSGDKWSTWSGFSENFKDACGHAGVDLKKVETEAKQTLEARKRHAKKTGAKKLTASKEE